eukprot:CAMPEP_0204918916 /NCGR_PEP_ID=MMETSP1397-20131031/16528_1 /ASSEMBLY_ACC=CAM_ASM_000891 /TAXON_ID=49980 /ORGANISM="Climacostomum Climacostomum virens, Strain Stock W-24" /LENGTH=314 /DNA_ID=CAMNT_0052092447 /DNA_START=1 /DNA_END=942 /DNA_ORIENTATION=+
MELPTELLVSILSFLTVKELYSSVALINREFAELMRNHKFREAVLYRDLHYIPSEHSDELYVSLLMNAPCFKASKKAIDFYGFATSGGVDVDMPYLWVRNMFESGEKGYSTQEEAFNVNCAAVLDNSMRYQNLMKVAVLLLRRLEQMLELEPQTVETLIDVLHALYDLRNSLNQSHRDIIPDYIRVMQQLQNHITPNVGMLTKKAYTELLLVENIDIDKANASKNFCVIHSLTISRKGSYTCPVASLIVFCSMSYVKVESPEFEKYNNLKTLEQLRLVSELDATFPLTGDEIETENYSYVEFKRSTEALVPMIW